MLKEVVGVRPYGFEDKKTGETISGCNVFLQWEEDDTDGICCEALSVSDKKLDGYRPGVGDKVRVGYNKYGKCDFLIAE